MIKLGMPEPVNAEAQKPQELSILENQLKTKIYNWLRKPGSSYLGEIDGVHLYAPQDYLGNKRTSTPEDRATLMRLKPKQRLVLHYRPEQWVKKGFLKREKTYVPETYALEYITASEESGEQKYRKLDLTRGQQPKFSSWRNTYMISATGVSDIRPLLDYEQRDAGVDDLRFFDSLLKPPSEVK